MKKQILALGLSAAMVVGMTAGCSSGSGAKDTAAADTIGTSQTATETAGTEGAGTVANEDLEGTLVFAIFDNNLMNYIDENDMVGKFKEVYPNADIEVEKLKDGNEYAKAMKIRASANQLPDVMFTRAYSLSTFNNYLLDLSDLQAAKDNTVAAGYALDGKIKGVPVSIGYEYVYYWKDMFKEAGVEVPTTWPELEEVSKKLQDYYGKDDKDFMAIGLGAKDEWATYPYMEFLPALISGNGANWDDMAKVDTPFAEGSDVNKAYTKAMSLFNSGVFGRDPLGLGNDQVTALFAQKKAAILALGDWGLLNIKNGTDDYSELGTFYLPARESKDEPFRVTVQGDSFMGVSTHSKHPELAKAFIEWFFSSEWYPDYINYITSASSMETFPKEKDPILAEADALQPDMEMVMYNGGGDDFQAIQNETTFNYKKLGVEMMTDGFDLQARFDEMDKKWTDARSKLGIQ